MDNEEIESIIKERSFNDFKIIPTKEEKKLVYELAKACSPIQYIAARVRDGIKVETLKKYFSKELTLGYGETNSEVIKTLYDIAVKDRNVQACTTWVSKNPQLRWSEKHEITSQEDEQIERIVIQIEE